MKKIIFPHPKKQSRIVTENDLSVVEKDSKDLLRICFESIGKYPGAIAMAHVQIEEKDPLRFFVKSDGEIVINPKIKERYDKYTHVEGCMSFPFRDTKKVARQREVMVECYSAYVGERVKLDKKVNLLLTDLDAAMYQHEIDHFNLNLLY